MEKSPRNQELHLASHNKLSGVLARIKQIEQEYPKLTRIPFPVLEFSFLKVSDRYSCGYCLNKDITSVAYAKSSMISQKFADNLNKKVRKFSIAKPEKLNQLLLKKRVDSILIMDFELDDKVLNKPDFIIDTLTRKQDYHYLAPKYAHLTQPLLEVFERLKRNGTLTRLQNKYLLHAGEEHIEIQSNAIAVSGSWTGFTNGDGTGVYWSIVKTIFDGSVHIETQEYSWQRALNLFETQKADILVGAYQDDIAGDYLFSNYHIDFEAPVYAFARTNELSTKFTQKDPALSVCIPAGEHLEEFVTFIPKQSIYSSTTDQCNKLFDSNKIDIFIEYEYNLDAHLTQFPRVEIKPSAPVFLAFHNTPFGRFLKQHFDHQLIELVHQKKLRGLYLTDEWFKQANIYQP